MVLVVGSTGVVGMGVVEHLRAKGKSVRALVRPGGDPAKRERLKNAGATVIEGDLKLPASLRAASEGIETVVSTASATISRGAGDTIDTVDRDGQLHLIDAARANNVRHFVYVSFSGNIEGDFPLNTAKRTVERHLQQSGLHYTIVRPSYFMEVWLSPHAGFDAIGGKARIYGSGESRVSVISARDVAAYVAGCVDNPAVVDTTIELGGPEAVSWPGVVKLFERALGRDIVQEHVPEQALEQQMTGAAEPLQRTLAGLALGLARGDVIDVRPALAKVGITLTPVEEFVSRVAGSAAPH
ncbi:MAG TPA: SDR family oxidoreductase [Vicinamibacterales bacterium]|nr:SDR family oxidoreductase [Vicinamibacterales bacterium]